MSPQNIAVTFKKQLNKKHIYKYPIQTEALFSPAEILGGSNFRYYNWQRW